MTLYAVTIERTLMVVAESRLQAENLAHWHQLDGDLNFLIDEVTEPRDVPCGWLDRMPYGSDKTVKGLLD